MANSWLLLAERDAFLVKPKFMERLRQRKKTALRQLLDADLTTLYRHRFTRLTKRQLQPGLFWSNLPPHERIPVVRGARNPPPEFVRMTIENEEGKRMRVQKPNPKFELVVVNRYDRAALQQLLNELDSASNVEMWLAERTTRTGATAPSVLYSDYSTWCEKRGDAATGTKSFSQALVSAKVPKLNRGNGSMRYALTLRPA